MKKVFGLIVFVALGVTGFAQSGMPLLKGWRSAITNGSYEFTPDVIPKPEFSYTILPLTTGSDQSLTDWLPVVAARNLADSGWTVSADVKAQSGKIDAFITWSAVVEDKLARRMSVSYMAYRKDSATIRYGKVMAGTNGTNQAYLNSAIQHFIDLARTEGMIEDKQIGTKKKRRQGR